MSDEIFPVTRTDEEWRALLTPEQYDVMRRHGTERPGSCALNHEKRRGAFQCAGCGQPLFRSGEKFDSGTGWPSFFDPLPGALASTVGSQLRHGANGSALQPLRRASRPCVPRWPAADRAALLHQRRRAEFPSRRRGCSIRLRDRPIGNRAIGATLRQRGATKFFCLPVSCATGVVLTPIQDGFGQGLPDREKAVVYYSVPSIRSAAGLKRLNISSKLTAYLLARLYLPDG